MRNVIMASIVLNSLYFLLCLLLFIGAVKVGFGDSCVLSWLQIQTFQSFSHVGILAYSHAVDNSRIFQAAPLFYRICFLSLVLLNPRQQETNGL